MFYWGAPIAPQFRSTEPMELFLKEKRSSLASSTGSRELVKTAKIKDSNGSILFEVDTETAEFLERRTLVDADGGCDVGSLCRWKVPDLPHPVYHIGTAADEKLCTLIQSHGAISAGITRCDANIYVGHAKVGVASSDPRTREFTIAVDGRDVASIKRGRRRNSSGLTKLMAGPDSSSNSSTSSYRIRIHKEGVDVAFISLLALALDDLHNSGDDYLAE